MAQFNGIYAVTITPFKEDGSIDYEYTTKYINSLIEAGVHGLLPLGATGEFASLSLEERMEYAEFIVKLVAGRVPVIIGAVSQNADVTIAICKHAKEIGAAGAMVLPAPGLHLSQAEIYAYYEHVNANVDLPIMMYNNPGSAGVNIDPELVVRLAALSNVCMIKESTGDIARLTRTVDELADELSIFCGCETLAHESFVMGANAWVCVVANFAPHMAVALYENIVVKGDVAAAREINKKLLPFLRLLEESGELWQVVKYTLEKQGMGATALRLPRLPISDAVKQDVDALLAAYDYN